MFGSGSIEPTHGILDIITIDNDIDKKIYKKY